MSNATSETPIRTVGVIGAGRMGQPIIGHMARKGFTVLAHDVDGGPSIPRRLVPRRQEVFKALLLEEKTFFASLANKLRIRIPSRRLSLPGQAQLRLRES